MEDFSKYINRDRDNYPFDELRVQNLPLFVWGAGDVAFNVVERLTEKSIDISGYIDKDDSAGLSKDGYAGKSVYTYKEACEKAKSFNVILGFALYEKIKEIEQLCAVNKVFYILNPYPYEGMSGDYYLANKKEIDKAMDYYDDDISQKLYKAYIRSQLSNDLNYILEAYDSPISYFDNAFIRLSDHENYVDVGAYDGDTVDMFLRQTKNHYASITAIEADSDIFKRLEKNLLQRELKDIHLINIGVYDVDGTLFFKTDGSSQNGVFFSSPEGIPMEVSKLDTLAEQNKIENISFIKINFTRSTVIPVLEGAKRILLEDRPKLAIIAGLYDDTIYKAPEVIKKINKDYKVYLRFLTAMPARIAIFAVME